MLVTPPSGLIGPRSSREQGLKAMSADLLSGLYYTDIATKVNNNIPAAEGCRMCFCFKNMSKMENKSFRSYRILFGSDDYK